MVKADAEPVAPRVRWTSTRRAGVIVGQVLLADACTDALIAVCSGGG